MKRTAALAAWLTALAEFVYLQTVPPPLEPAALMPGGAALYLETRDFSRLLREWDASPVKAGWLAKSGNVRCSIVKRKRFGARPLSFLWPRRSDLCAGAVYHS